MVTKLLTVVSVVNRLRQKCPQKRTTLWDTNTLGKLREQPSSGLIPWELDTSLSWLPLSSGWKFLKWFPSLFQHSRQLFTVNLVLFIYAMINIIGNYYYLITTDTSYKKTDALSEERDGVFFCQSCEQNSPPRSHHCSFCDKCVLRRDHHCFFTATCVGHANTRFFLVFNFFVFIASAYVVVINFFYSTSQDWSFNSAKLWSSLQGSSIVDSVQTVYRKCHAIFFPGGYRYMALSCASSWLLRMFLLSNDISFLWTDNLWMEA